MNTWAHTQLGSMRWQERCEFLKARGVDPYHPDHFVSDLNAENYEKVEPDVTFNQEAFDWRATGTFCLHDVSTKGCYRKMKCYCRKNFKELEYLVYAADGKFSRFVLNERSGNRDFMEAYGAYIRRPCFEGVKCWFLYFLKRVN